MPGIGDGARSGPEGTLHGMSFWLGGSALSPNDDADAVAQPTVNPPGPMAPSPAFTEGASAFFWQKHLTASFGFTRVQMLHLH